MRWPQGNREADSGRARSARPRALPTVSSTPAAATAALTLLRLVHTQRPTFHVLAVQVGDRSRGLRIVLEFDEAETA